MNQHQSKSAAGLLILLMCSFLSMGDIYAEPFKPGARPRENKPFNPELRPEERKAHREYMENHEALWPITVALTSRDARNPRPLSKEWQQRIVEAAGIQLEYTQGTSGDEHIFKPIKKKMIPAAAEEIAARIRALPGIQYAETPSLEMGLDLAVPTDPIRHAVASEGRRAATSKQ